MSALDGVRVLDLTRLLPGPLCTMLLADLGATVDKVEDPGGGDYLRNMPPMLGQASALYALLNRSKRSIVLDLKKPEGRDALLAMLPRYDVVIEQFRPGVMDRLGLGPEALMRENERLVVCSLTGYGQSGPLCERAGHDLNYLARAGVLAAQGPAFGPAQVPGSQQADVGGALYSAIAILAALLERQRTGRGRHLDVAMTEAAMTFAVPMLAAAISGSPLTAGGEVLTGGIAPYRVYRTKDGRAMALAALEPKFWLSFCAHVGIEPSLEALMPGPHQADWVERLTTLFASRSRDEWVLFTADKDCMLEPVLEPSELRADPHHLERGVFFTLETTEGPLPQVRTPLGVAGARPEPPAAAGAHTREILGDAGLSPQAIEALLGCGAARDGA